MDPRVTIVIPTYQHAAFVREAIASALAQTEPCHVLVVDDGSTDETEAVLDSVCSQAIRSGQSIEVVRIPHGGPSVARNVGIDRVRGEFVMFLDADDVILPHKVKTQLDAFSDDVGWVLCDVQIEDDVRGKVTTASDQYRYAHRQLGGWIAPQLEAANFIPCMAPLVRTTVLREHLVRFLDRPREDWEFWYHVARVARMRYAPEVLAIYRKRRGGRNSVPETALLQAVPPLRLNLGCGTPGALSWHPMPGLVNLDRSLGWCFEDGLRQFADGTVDGITVSHALMYVHEDDWPKVCAEFARVLRPGGVVRITEDDTEHPHSARRGGWRGSEPAVTLTSPGFVRMHLEYAGLTAVNVDAYTSNYIDGSLCQAQHGRPPDVFFLEGIKP